MRISPKFSILLLSLCLSAALVGCSDDDNSGKNNDDPGLADVSDEADAQEDKDSSNNGGDPDVSEPEGEPDAGDQDATEESDADAEDATEPEDTSPPEMEREGCSFPPAEDADCPPEAYGDHGPASFINQLEVKSTQEWTEHMGMAGGSAVGEVAQAIEWIMQMPFNKVIEGQIEAGGMAFLFEYAYFSDPVNDHELDFRMMLGKDRDNDYSDNLAGEGEFVIDPRSLNADGTPISSFANTSVADGRLVAAEGNAVLMLPLDFNAQVVSPVRVQKISIEADVDPDADLMSGGGVKLNNGVLSGIVDSSEFFGALNSMADNCRCIQSDPLYVADDSGVWGCVDSIESSGCASSDEICQTFSNQRMCEAIGEIINDNADVNTSGGETNDALSLGATFSAVGASIVGVAN